MSIDAERLLATARERAGVEGFGEDSWREGFDHLVTSLNAEAALTELGIKITAARLVRLLANRLRIEQTYEEHPEIADQRVQAPVFIIGLPRTGTTALSQLIQTDPQIRSLRVWESSDPVPPPESATEHTDPRIARAQAEQDATYTAYPEMRYLYFQTATTATECQDLLGMAFRTVHFEGNARADSYVDWVLGADMRPAYRYHVRVLRLLQWHCPPRQWHLKTPVHMLSLDALDEIYPDARFIWTHRDPAKVLGSVCDLIAYLRRMVSDVNEAELGLRQLDLWSEAVRRSMSFRERVGESRFSDVAFGEIQSDPISAVETAYKQLGLSLGQEARAAMERWRAENPPGGRGTHSYTLEQFGVSEDAIRERFAAYRERFLG